MGTSSHGEIDASAKSRCVLHRNWRKTGLRRRCLARVLRERLRRLHELALRNIPNRAAARRKTFEHAQSMRHGPPFDVYAGNAVEPVCALCPRHDSRRSSYLRRRICRRSFHRRFPAAVGALCARRAWTHEVRIQMVHTLYPYGFPRGAFLYLEDTQQVGSEDDTASCANLGQTYNEDRQRRAAPVRRRERRAPAPE